MNGPPNGFSQPPGFISQCQSTRVPAPTGVKVYLVRPVPPYEALINTRATAWFVSSSVTSMTLSMVLPNTPFTTTRRSVPILGGPSVSSSPSSALVDHFGD